jgi:hypothetical protein
MPSLVCSPAFLKFGISQENSRFKKAYKMNLVQFRANNFVSLHMISAVKNVWFGILKG